ncbi:MAG TPA: hypothetical protein VKE24_06145 [Candidatus Acidoferrales bacterium]|nr:hypothetical protein [Candidatus Acidoferrales bacterium]
MDLNDLLKKQGIDPQQVLALRHRPHEPELNKVFPWLAAEKPAVFNAYQQTQGPKLEKVMVLMGGSGYIASFIGHEPGKALFVGLYSIAGSRPLTYGRHLVLIGSGRGPRRGRVSPVRDKTSGRSAFTCRTVK